MNLVRHLLEQVLKVLPPCLSSVFRAPFHWTLRLLLFSPSSHLYPKFPLHSIHTHSDTHSIVLTEGLTVRWHLGSAPPAGVGVGIVLVVVPCVIVLVVHVNQRIWLIVLRVEVRAAWLRQLLGLSLLVWLPPSGVITGACQTTKKSQKHAHKSLASI